MHINTFRAQTVRDKTFGGNYVKMRETYNRLYNDNLSLSAIKRYCGGGIGYETGAKSEQFQRFIDVMFDLI